MDFGRNGLRDKIYRVRSKGTRVTNKILSNCVKIIMFVFVSGIVIFGSMLIGAYNGIIDGTPSVSDVNIMPSGYATFIYDVDGNQLQKLNSADGNRIAVSIDEIPVNMQHAIVAIEDSRFYEHNGVDTVGMVRAAAVAISSGFSRTEGASTITQQLLKNNVFTNWTEESKIERIERKLQEQYLAVELEKALTAEGMDTKSVILENYLNTVNFGSGTYGIQAASLKYFGKNSKDLTLSECAVLAAIPQNPTKWNPIRHPENNRERQQTVLNYMYQQGYITEEELNEALADDVYSRISAHDAGSQTEEQPYSYFVDELIGQVKEQLIKQKGYTELQAEQALYSGGLRIYTTMDSNIQSIMEEEFSNEENYPQGTQYALEWALTVDHADGERENYSREMLQAYFKKSDSSFDLIFDSEEEAQAYVDQYKAAIIGEGDTIVAERFSTTAQPQAAMVVMDQSTGYVKGIIGGRGKKTASLVLNRATDSYRQPGSTFKILSTYGPALDMGKITLATLEDDTEYSYSDGTPIHNADDQYHGTVTIRDAIEHSYNIVAVKVLTEITPKAGFKYLEKLGFSKLVDDTNYDVRQPLALGGITNGVSTLELAAAYAAIANNGEYIEPKFYTKVTDQYGNVILDNTSEKQQVFKKSTAYLLTSAMQDVVNYGTGTDFAISDMNLAGKTGTTTSYKDLVFAGFTPYYTAAIWAGYDVSTTLPEYQRGYYKVLWNKVMTRIHEGLENKDFEQPSDVVSADICVDSGLLAGYGCNTITEYFDKSDVPTQRCTRHTPVPTATPRPTELPTSTPTPTVTPTPSVAPTEDVEPTVTVEPTPEPEPTQEPEPTE